MGLHNLFDRLSDDGLPENGVEGALQGAMAAASPVYGVGAWINRTLHETGLMERRRLPATVLSVGNITLGGTGKTPFVCWLVEWLKKQHRKPVVLSRGYGREDEQGLVLVHDGKRLRANAREAGDEPVLLARALGNVPVIACADRYRAGRYALRRFEADTIVLDDGFQHHRLERQGDIVLVDATKRLSDLKVFPRGTLRESPGALQRAHLIVLTRWNQAEEGPAVQREVRKAAPSTAIVHARVLPGATTRVHDGSAVAAESLAGRRAVLLCGVANPQSVKDTVASLGVKVVSSRLLADHEAISEELLRAAEAKRERTGADFIIITEKDAVKLVRPETAPESVIAISARIVLASKRDRDVASRVLRSRLNTRFVAGYLK